jgi:hypothetical protein
MKIAILTPVYGSPRTAYVRSLADLLIFTAQNRPDIQIRYRLAEGHLIQNRNALAKAATDADADKALWIDADISFAPDALSKLIDRGKAVVGANYPTRTHPPLATAERDSKPILTAPGQSGIEPADNLGLGFVLIDTAVMRQIGEPVFRPHPTALGWPGEDVDFFRRIREAGVEVFVDHDVSQRVAHVTEHLYTNAVAAHFATL